MTHFAASPPAQNRRKAANRRHARRDLAPLLGRVLLGAVALPSLATGANAAQPPQKLKLTLALANLTISEPATGIRLSPEASTGDAAASSSPRLRLAESITRLAAAEAMPAVLAPASAASAQAIRPSPEKLAQSTPAGATESPATTREEGVAARDATDAAAESEEDRTPAEGSDAQVIGSDEFLPADELDTDLLPSEAPDGRRGRPDDAEAPARPTRRWGVAPIRWGGDVSIGISRTRSGDGDPTMTQVYQGRLRANSYIWQPYIALVATDFALTTNRSHQGGDAASSNLTGTSITGSGNLNVFPQSRFPFTAALTLSDSRSEGSFSDTNVSSRRLSLRQQYRPPVGQWSAAANYDRSELIGDFGRDVVDRIAGYYTTQLGRHSVNLTGEASRNESEQGSGRTLFAAGNHSVQLGNAFSLATSANVLDQETSLEAAGGSQDARVSSAQVYTFVNWIPPESKWRGNGSLRYFQTRSEFDGNVFDQRQLSGNVGLNYQASRNLNLAGSAGFNLDQDGQSSTSQSLSASYSGDPRQLGNYSYNWSTSASMSNAQSSRGAAARTLSGTVSHSLSRYWLLDESSSLNASVGQSVSNSRSSGAGSVTSTSLNHSASLSLSANAGDRLNGFLSANLSDNRTMGDTSSVFQMLNVQLSGNWRIDAYSGLSSNLTWQLTRQESRGGEPLIITDEFGRPLEIDDSSENQSSSLSGSLGYGHRRFLGVRGLRYRADFRANTGTSRSARRFGDPNADRPEDQVTMELDQRLYFSIGRLDTEVQFRIAEIQGQRSERIFIRATRSFGAF